MTGFRNPTHQERDYCIELSEIIGFRYEELPNNKKGMLYSLIKSKYYTPEKHEVLKQILKDNTERSLLFNLIDFTKELKKCYKKGDIKCNK
ncbi:MAG: hypothetical protein M0P94_05255 [Candidatus Absconditabacterales bacterium]|nr:hypothetical protein [Candidatus Absconditabacterales bacterium]